MEQKNIIDSNPREDWDSWFDGEGVSDDFMTEREQPDDQNRDSL